MKNLIKKIRDIYGQDFVPLHVLYLIKKKKIGYSTALTQILFRRLANMLLILSLACLNLPGLNTALRQLMVRLDCMLLCLQLE